MPMKFTRDRRMISKIADIMIGIPNSSWKYPPNPNATAEVAIISVSIPTQPTLNSNKSFLKAFFT